MGATKTAKDTISDQIKRGRITKLEGSRLCYLTADGAREELERAILRQKKTANTQYQLSAKSADSV